MTQATPVRKLDATGSRELAAAFSAEEAVYRRLLRLAVRQNRYLRRQDSVRLDDNAGDRGWEVTAEASRGSQENIRRLAAGGHRVTLFHRGQTTLELPAGVDIEIRRSMWEFIRGINDSGTTVILTTHYLEEAESLCNNIAIIDHGVTIEQTQMRTLLDRLHIETFVLYLAEPLETLPECGDYLVRIIDNTTLEVDVHDKQNLSDLFNTLKNGGIEIVSMKNKTNRLEQLFISMLNNKRGAAA